MTKNVKGSNFLSNIKTTLNIYVGTSLTLKEASYRDKGYQYFLSSVKFPVHIVFHIPNVTLLKIYQNTVFF